MSGVLVVVETRRGELRDVSWEAIGAARALADAGAGSVTALVVAADPAPFAQAVAGAGVDAVLTVASPTEHFEPHAQAKAVAAVVAATAPSVVIAGHTIDAMGWAPAVALTGNTGLVTDAMALRWEDGGVVAERGDYGDRLVATLAFGGHATTVATVRPGAFAAASVDGGSAPIREADGVTLAADDARSEHVAFLDVEAGDVDITKADFLLSIGRGVEDEADVERYARLAEALGATLSASRPLIDAGWLPAARQVGQSGRTVKPKVYLALGISGAVQHLIGMKGADTIIAVNTDPEAPIFKVAHYGAVADLEDVSEALAQHFG